MQVKRVLLVAANVGALIFPSCSIYSIQEWLPSWKRNGWRKADKTEVKNQDLLVELDSEIGARR